MVRLDHLSLPVVDWRKSRDWYKEHLGFEVEFEIPDRLTAASRGRGRRKTVSRR